MKKLIAMFVIVFACFNTCLSLAKTSKLQQHEGSAPSRFVLNRGEVFDKLTNLTWCRCSAGSTWTEGIGCVGSPKLMSFEEAKQFAKQADDGWRIPTIEELHSIVEQDLENPAINPIIFPNVQDFSEGAPYWSATRVEEIPILIYYIDFMSGRVDGHSEGFIMAVRLVRNPK